MIENGLSRMPDKGNYLKVMKKMSRSTLMARLLAVAVLVTLLVVLYIKIFDVGGDSSPSTHPRPLAQSQSPASPPQKSVPKVERSLTQEVPFVGKVQGARWIANHQFQTIRTEDERKGPLVDRGLDVLVDDEGYFLAARFNGERFATKPHEASLKNLLRNATFYSLKTMENISPKVPEITMVSSAKLRWDDLGLGDSIRKLVNRSFQGNHHDNALSRFEETYYAFEVTYAGETKPRHIVVRRYTEGLAEGGVPYPPYGIPWDVGDAIRNSNRYGATVVYMAWEIGSARDLQGPISLLYLTEPWAGPCPWPLDKLDPYYGENRPDEFAVPAEFLAGEMPDLLDWPPNTEDPRKYFKLQAEKNKANRLAMEASNRSGH